MRKITTAKLEAMLRKLRAAAAREYSYREDMRRIYRDGFTEGWNARDDINVLNPHDGVKSS